MIGLALSLASILIIFQMVRIQNSTKHQELSRWADEEYSYAIENYYPERGNIYDRWGRLLAGNEDVYEVGCDARICQPTQPQSPRPGWCQ